MELTLKADPKLIQKMKVLSRKRNATSYDATGSISAQELKEALKVARELRRSVADWLKQNHPELMKNS